ncbi:MAG TPA: glycerophosphodiester phosphodiesterase family protein [Blastocatellia bacterium]|jgi:glycerophosphoryl diester phosphodiesterase|nr:glycerophosphodiester phosphodiesterase family protein [Blastocatellia bacterium]
MVNNFEMVTPLFKSRRPAISHNRKPLVIAHRGASGFAPENTLAAFKLAIALGADGVELDTQLSADGRAVVIHDARVNRTTNATGRVASFTAAELQKLDAGEWFKRRLMKRPRLRATLEREAGFVSDGGGGSSREPVPTLESVFALLAPVGLRRIYVEFKGGQASRGPLVEAVISLVREFRLERAVTLLSFDHESVRLAKQVASDIRTAATFSIAGRRLITARAIISAARSVDADEAALHYGLVTRRAVEALHENRLVVSAWTANSRLVMRRLAACGVDSIMTNYPKRLIETLGSHPPPPPSVPRNDTRERSR